MRIKLDLPLKLWEITELLLDSPPVSTDRAVTALSIDTRELSEGDLFFSLSKDKKQRYIFAKDALNRGAIVFTEDDVEGCFKVKNGQIALIKLAAAYKAMLPCLKATVAITGSVGKTTQKDILAHILSQKYKIHKSYKNYNNRLGLSLSVLSAPAETEILILEMGMNSLGEISELSKYFRPDLGIITNVGTSHIGNLGSREDIARAKSELAHGIDRGVIITPDEPLLHGLKNRVIFDIGRRIFPFCIDNVRKTEKGFCFDFFTRERSLLRLNMNLRGEHLLNAAGFALSLCSMLGLSEEEIRLGISTADEALLGRRLVEVLDFTVLLDCYNAAYESIEADLRFIRELDYPACSALLGDLLELGEYTEGIHRNIGKLAAKMKLHYLFLMGNYAEYIAAGAIEEGFPEERIFINPSPSDHGKSAADILAAKIRNEIILFKASRKLELEKVLDILKITESYNAGY